MGRILDKLSGIGLISFILVLMMIPCFIISFLWMALKPNGFWQTAAMTVISVFLYILLFIIEWIIVWMVD